MKKLMFVLVLLALLVMPSTAAAGGGFDEWGYNLTARNFVGTGWSWCMGKVGDETWCADYLGPYANDKLVMKWNAEWDRGNAEGWSDPDGYDAWCSNEWNGMVPGGSGETWHYKQVWDQGCRDTGEPSGGVVKGNGYCIWGQFAVIMSHGTYDGQHFWDVLVNPAGYGFYP
jgi:hypothetical protein